MQLNDEDIKAIEQQIKEYNFKAGLTDFEIFIESPIWEDFRNNLVERLGSLQSALEDLANTEKMNIVYKSRIHEIRQLLAYPDNVIKLLKALENDDD